MWELVLEVHDGGEAIDGGVDGAAAAHAGVDRDGDGIGAGVADGDAIDGEDSVIDLALDDSWKTNQEAISCEYTCISDGTITYIVDMVISGATHNGKKVTRAMTAPTMSSAHHHFFTKRKNFPLFGFSATSTSTSTVVVSTCSFEAPLELLILAAGM